MGLWICRGIFVIGIRIGIGIGSGSGIGIALKPRRYELAELGIRQVEPQIWLLPLVSCLPLIDPVQ